MKKHNRKLQRTAVILCLILMVLVSTSVTAFAANYHTTAEIKVTNKISGTYSTSEKFKFVLESKNGAPMPTDDVLEITGAGTASFSIPYDKIGIYEYTLTEKRGNGSYWTYDSTVYNIAIYVLRNEKTDQLEPIIIIYDGKGVKADGVVFTNRYYRPVIPTPSASSGTTGGPKTGDADSAVWYVLIMIAAAVCAGIAVILIRKKKTEE